MNFVPIDIGDGQNANIQIVRTSVKHGIPALSSDRADLLKYVTANLDALTTHVKPLKAFARKDKKADPTERDVKPVLDWLVNQLTRVRTANANLFQSTVYVVLRTHTSHTYLQLVSSKANTSPSGTVGFLQWGGAQPRQAQPQPQQNQQAPNALELRVRQVEAASRQANQLNEVQTQQVRTAITQLLEHPDADEALQKRLRSANAPIRMRMIHFDDQRKRQAALNDAAASVALNAQSFPGLRNELYAAAVRLLDPSNAMGETFLTGVNEALGDYHVRVLDVIGIDTDETPLLARLRTGAAPLLQPVWLDIHNQHLGAVVASYEVDEAIEPALKRLLWEAAQEVARPQVERVLDNWVASRRAERARVLAQAARAARSQSNLTPAQLVNAPAQLEGVAQAMGQWDTAEHGACLIATSLAALEGALGDDGALLIDIRGGDELIVRTRGNPSGLDEQVSHLAAAIQAVRGPQFRFSGDAEDAEAWARKILASQPLDVRQDLQPLLW